MAIGDAADAAGMVVLAGTEDLRESYIEHNRTRDYLADHQTSGTHAAGAIVTGTVNPARLPALGTMSGIAPAAAMLNAGADGTIAAGGGQITATGNLNITGAVAAAGLVTLYDVYGNTVAGHGGWRTANVAADGVFGGVTSSARFKQDIVLAEIPRATLRAWRPKFYRYIADVESPFPSDAVHLGGIAEEAHELGFTFLVDYARDETGALVPYAINDRMVPYLVMLLAQDAEDRLDALTVTVYDLQADLIALRGDA